MEGEAEAVWSTGIRTDGAQEGRMWWKGLAVRLKRLAPSAAVSPIEPTQQFSQITSCVIWKLTLVGVAATTVLFGRRFVGSGK